MVSRKLLPPGVRTIRYILTGVVALAIALLVWSKASPVVAYLPVPTIQIVTPTNSEVIFGTKTVECMVQAAPGAFPGIHVQYFVDGGLAATNLAAPYLFPFNTVPLTNETHSLTARLVDSAGNVLASATSMVKVDNAFDNYNINRQIIQAADGVVAVVSPRMMTVSTSYMIEVRVAKRFRELLAKGVNTGETSDSMSHGYNPAASRENTTPTKVGDIMVARLVGDGFKIDAITPEKQPIPNADYTRWSWSVTPQLIGARALYISLCIVISSNRRGDGELLYALPIQYRAVDVSAGVIERIRRFAAENIWLTILGACLAALANLWLRHCELSLKKRSGERKTDLHSS